MARRVRYPDVMARLAPLGLALTVAVTALVTGTGAQQAAPANLDFENGPPGEPPPGWMLSVPQPPPGVSVRTVTDERVRGGQAVLLTRDASAGPGASLNLLQLVDATPYRGRRVRFRMAVRPGPSSTAQMWMRIEGPAPQGGAAPTFFLDTMDERPITTPAWNHYEIVGDVPPQATRLIVGVFLPVPGQVWVDDASVESVARPEPAPIEAPRAITRRGLVNLMAFARLLGYVRHFHPSDAAARTDWDAFAIEGVRAVESSADGAVLTQRLNDLFRPIAPAAVIVESGTAPKAAPADAAAAQLAWRHIGFGLSTAQTTYRSERVPAPGALPLFAAELGGGVTVRLPLTVPVDAGGSASSAPAPPRLTRGRFPAADRATRLAAVMLAWNVFQHAYPYFDPAAASWSTSLSAALHEAALDATERDFVATLRRTVAALHDGQARVLAASDAELQFSAPLALEWIEGALVVTAADATTGVRPGDIVVTLDGTPAPLAIEAVEAFISGATPQWRRARAVRDVLLGPKGTPLRLRLERDGAAGAPVDVTVTRTVNGAYAPDRGAALQEPEPGIIYLDLARLGPAEFSAALPRLAAAKGLVFDLREPPPSLSPDALLAPLVEATVTSPQVHVPQIVRPDREATSFTRAGEWRVEPRAPRLAAPKVFLAGPRSIAYAESLLAVVDQYTLGRIVGEPTAGTDGPINRFQLPGDYTVFFTGAKVLRHDGRPLHGVGITPDVVVPPTRAGAAAGRDEALERAIALLRTPAQ